MSIKILDINIVQQKLGHLVYVLKIFISIIDLNINFCMISIFQEVK